MKSISLKTIILALIAFLGAATLSQATDVPQFKDYPAKIYSGHHAQVQLETPEAQNFKTRLREGAKQPVNFAGNQILVEWGCGSTCVSGAVINAQTGKVVFLPHTICCWGETDSPFYIKPNSRLIVFGGMLDEQEPAGAHFFEFDGVEFKPLQEQPQKNFAAVSGGGTDNSALPDIATPETSSMPVSPEIAAVEPSAGDEENKATWSKLWDMAGRKEYDFIMLCYLDKADELRSQVMTYAADPEFEYKFIKLGGNAKIAELAMEDCNGELRKTGYIESEKSFDEARNTLKITSAKMDIDYLRQCKSDICKSYAKTVLTP
ncbi:hypothetical protein B5K11_20015 [Rhizobium leguminosarum bv. trifolii]|uniref:hypothetical protein n=1 Tax=Rhizobium leguminosarum TaxID=384 RepID=UPI000E2EA25B|nr:hypothetical protein [Rhizobium leguminosarum]RFB90342.1 hypothetical protein B5K11_20015 [Rhizobium leguminosarum bv. trifolii]